MNLIKRITDQPANSNEGDVKWHELKEEKIMTRNSNHGTASKIIKSNIDSKSSHQTEINDSFTEKQQQIYPKQQDSEHYRSITYRPDIDGLRTIAILLVLIYHAFPTSKLTGGFIGVDVFFVISGFLITQIIVKEINKQKFSIINFYCRRIKRIYPALIIVLSFALWVISKFQEFDLTIFSLNTLDSALVFGANINILLHKQDYFDADIRGNPLLHLWSLGVEEQFYIIWPYLLVLMLKFFRKRSMLILVVYTVFSFIFSVFMIYTDSKFAFYFPLCRFWQMSVGGILGYLQFTFYNRWINNALSLIGVTMIVGISFILNDESLFPGFWALIPTLGCAFVIQAGSQSFINKYILASKPFTFIGKISYSLYLWHWPLLVYSRLMYPHGSTSLFANTYFIVAITFGLTILTYFVAENPIRKMKNKKIVILLLVLMAGVGIASIPVRNAAEKAYFSQDDFEMMKFFNQVNRQMTPEPEDYVMIGGRKQPNFSYNKNRILPTNISQVRAQWIEEKYEQAHGGEFLLQKPVTIQSEFGDMLEMSKSHGLHNFSLANEGQKNKLYLIGDSHTMKITYRFQELFRKSKIKGTLDKFPTIVTALRRGWVMSEINHLLNFTRTLVAKHKPQRILFAWNWIYYVCRDLKTPMNVPANCDGKWTDYHLKQFINFVVEIRNLGIQVYSIGVDINHIQYFPANMYDENGFILENLKPFRYSDFRKKYKLIFDKVENGLNNANITWIDSAINHCWEDICHVVSPKGYAPFIDIDHMGKFYSSHWFTAFDHLIEF